jgi:hypothetical protein
MANPNSMMVVSLEAKTMWSSSHAAAIAQTIELAQEVFDKEIGRTHGKAAQG